MKRRTFLKAVFAAAVAPASVVKCLYEPKAVAVEWTRISTTYHWDNRELIKGQADDYIREGQAVVRSERSGKISFKGVPLEFKPNLDYTDNCLYIQTQLGLYRQLFIHSRRTQIRR